MSMSKRKILVIGATERLRRRVVSLLNNLKKSITTTERDDCAEISLYFSEHRIDAVMAECDLNVEETIEQIRQSNPAIPVIMYGEEPGYDLTRKAFIHGALDVLKIRSITVERVGEVLDHAFDPLRLRSVDEVQHQMQSIRIISQRGRYLEHRLLEGNPPPFYMNGNRATLLRANVLCTEEALLWQQDAAWEWVQEFGVNNSFMFSSSCRELKVGAIVEQDFVNAAAFKRMLTAKLERCFSHLKEINCICAASWCNADFLSMTALQHLDSLTDLVFYLDESQVIPDEMQRKNTTLPAELYSEFYSAAIIRDAPAAISCIDGAVEKLRADMPPPSFTRFRLNRFLWDFASAVGSLGDLSFPLEMDDTRIQTMRDSIVRIIESALNNDGTDSSLSPLTELIHRIEANPGLSINIDQATKETNFSRSHFCRLFRQQTGLSFTAFLTRKRIEMACDLMKKTGMRVDEISNIVGINNTWYFKKLFCKEMGMTVEEWLRANCPSKAQ